MRVGDMSPSEGCAAPGIVVDPSAFCGDRHFLQREEDLRVEEFVAQLRAEALTHGVRLQRQFPRAPVSVERCRNRPIRVVRQPAIALRHQKLRSAASFGQGSREATEVLLLILR